MRKPDEAIYMILEQPIAMVGLWIGRTEVVFCWQSHTNQQEATSITATQSTCQTHTMDDSCSHWLTTFDSNSHTFSFLQVLLTPFPYQYVTWDLRPSGTLRRVQWYVVPYGRSGTTYRYHLQGSRHTKIFQDRADESWACCVCCILDCLWGFNL